MKCKSIFISDIHLWNKFSQADKCLDFLKMYECENLFLVWDIIDWRAMKRKIRRKKSFSDLLHEIMSQSHGWTNVYFIVWNHDEFLRQFLPIVIWKRIKFLNKINYVWIDQKRYLVIHWDFFDIITLSKKYLAVLWDYWYRFLLNLNWLFNKIASVFWVWWRWSLSKFVKQRVKRAVNFITDFEKILAKYAKQNKYDGVICGHIHKAEMKNIDWISYMNSWDWVESCTAIIEHSDWTWELFDYLKDHKNKIKFNRIKKRKRKLSMRRAFRK